MLIMKDTSECYYVIEVNTPVDMSGLKKFGIATLAVRTEETLKIDLHLQSGHMPCLNNPVPLKRQYQTKVPYVSCCSN